MNTLRGRCIRCAPPSLTMRNASGKVEITIDPSISETCQPGDIVEVDTDARRLRVLTRARRPSRRINQVLNPRRLQAMQVRARMENGIREFFTRQGFLETRTPLL